MHLPDIWRTTPMIEPSRKIAVAYGFHKFMKFGQNPFVDKYQTITLVVYHRQQQQTIPPLENETQG